MHVNGDARLGGAPTGVLPNPPGLAGLVQAPSPTRGPRSLLRDDPKRLQGSQFTGGCAGGRDGNVCRASGKASHRRGCGLASQRPAKVPASWMPPPVQRRPKKRTADGDNRPTITGPRVGHHRGVPARVPGVLAIAKMVGKGSRGPGIFGDHQPHQTNGRLRKSRGRGG